MFIVELSFCGSVSVCRPNGSEISPKSKLGRDLADCCKSGDCQDACQSDETIRENIEANEYEFDENGNLFRIS
jgi:hypothetical protein